MKLPTFEFEQHICTFDLVWYFWRGLFGRRCDHLFRFENQISQLRQLYRHLSLLLMFKLPAFDFEEDMESSMDNFSTIRLPIARFEGEASQLEQPSHRC